MIPKYIIEKAIEGGWKFQRSDRVSDEEAIEITLLDWERIALDPSFWQSLGKSLGWVTHTMSGELPLREQDWYIEAKRFYNLILTGGDTEKFWNELYPLNKK